MNFNKIKIYKSYFIGFFSLIIIFLMLFFFKNQSEKDKKVFFKPITVNLLTSVHPNLSWSFQPLKPKIFVKPGEVITVEYIVENLGNEEGTGIATFQYFPKQYGTYINKINCFCYDAQNLKAKEKTKYTFVMFIDPEATKDSKTRRVKDITIQFTFFDYKEYKKTEN